MKAKLKLDCVQCRDSLDESTAIEAMREYAISLLDSAVGLSRSEAQVLINDFEGERVYLIESTKLSGDIFSFVNLREVAKMNALSIVASLQTNGIGVTREGVMRFMEATYNDMTKMDSIKKSAKQFDEEILNLNQ